VLFRSVRDGPSNKYWYDNIDSNADDDYEAGWESGDWWEPTLLNDTSGSDNGEGAWASKDTNYPANNQLFNVDWIQDKSNTSGLFIDSQHLQEQEGGGFVSLLFDSNIGNFPCVTKIFYSIDYFVPTNIGQDGGEIEGEPSAFWAERNLVNRGANDCETFGQVLTKNIWQINYDTVDWATFCEVPNNEHTFDAYPDDYRYQTSGLGGDGFNNINLAFGTTKSHSSIQWGLPQMVSGIRWYASSCIANLKQFYTLQDVLINDYQNREFYTTVKGRVDDDDNVISKPHTILQNILKKELDYQKEVILPDEIIEDDWIHSFSMNKQEEAKRVIENLFKSSMYVPSFDSGGNFKFIDLKRNITNYDQFEAIDNQDILKYSFGLTKLEDIKNQVNVKYKKDYGSGDLLEETGYGIEDWNGNSEGTETLDKLTFTLNTDDMVYDIGYYGMTDSDAKLEVETEYIRDKDTARKLQRRLLMWYANQHLTMKLTLPASYIHLEVGDYIRFDELIGGKLAFGFDYTQEFVKNGQLIYPVFFITKVAKSLTKVSLELVQVHRGDFGMDDDDLNQYEIFNPYDNNIYEDEDEEEEGDADQPYFEVEMGDNDDLGSGEVAFVVNTNIETDITYEIILWYSSHSFTYRENEIEEDYNDENPNVDGLTMVNSNISITDSLYGDNVTITNRNSLQTRAGITYEDEDDRYEEIELSYTIIIKATADQEFSVEKEFHQIIPFDWHIQKGDVDEDGIINVQDLQLMIAYILGEASLNQYQKDAADMDDNGAVNISDVTLLLGAIIGN